MTHWLHRALGVLLVACGLATSWAAVLLVVSLAMDGVDWALRATGLHRDDWRRWTCYDCSASPWRLRWQGRDAGAGKAGLVAECTRCGRTIPRFPFGRGRRPAEE